MKLYAIIVSGILVGCGDLNVNGDPSVQVSTQGAKVEPAKTTTQTQTQTTTPAQSTTSQQPASALSTTQATTSLWTAEQFKKIVDVCQKQAMESSRAWRPQHEPMNATEAQSYCVCAYNGISTAYDYQTYTQNSSPIDGEARESGALQKCVNAIFTERGFSTSDQSCEYGKLCPGFNKNQVTLILGKPTTIDGQTWTWTEDPNAATVCANPNGGNWVYLRCSVTFNSQGFVVKQTDINPEKLDVSKW